jgi:hypothetical protein
MEISNLRNFKRGWVVGDFEPSLLKSAGEVGIQRYKAGDRHAKHYHEQCTEINVILEDSVLLIAITV